MVLKVILNVVYNLALFIMVLGFMWGIDKGKYSVAIFAVFVFALVLFLKIRLIKQIKQASPKRK